MSDPIALVEVLNFRGCAPNTPFDLGSGVKVVCVSDWCDKNGIKRTVTAGKSGVQVDSSLGLTCTFRGLDQIHEVYPVLRGALLSLWLAKPNGAYLGDLIAKTNGSSIAIRGTGQGRDHHFHANASYAKRSLETVDFDKAKVLWRGIAALKEDSNLWNVTWLLAQALGGRTFVPRFVFLCIALEALYGPEDGREITFRLAQRGAFFLKHSPEARTAMFHNLKKIYGLRSKTLHGLKLAKFQDADRDKLNLDAEMIVRDSLVKILPDSKLLDRFDTKDRESYLDELPFEKSPA